MLVYLRVWLIDFTNMDISDNTDWFLDCRYEASSLFHLGFLKTEVTIFGKEGDAEGESCNARRL